MVFKRSSSFSGLLFFFNRRRARLRLFTLKAGSFLALFSCDRCWGESFINIHRLVMSVCHTFLQNLTTLVLMYFNFFLRVFNFIIKIFTLFFLLTVDFTLFVLLIVVNLST